MLFGLPWYAVIAIVAIVGGLFYAYKEEELKAEQSRMGNTREFNELRQVVHNLKSRVENLEAIASEERSNRSNHDADPLGEIEIDDEVESGNSDNSSTSNIKNNLRN